MKRLDPHEKRNLPAHERGEVKSVVTSEASRRRYREYARATFTKSTLDLADIQAPAAMGD